MHSAKIVALGKYFIEMLIMFSSIPDKSALIYIAPATSLLEEIIGTAILVRYFELSTAIDFLCLVYSFLHYPEPQEVQDHPQLLHNGLAGCKAPVFHTQKQPYTCLPWPYNQLTQSPAILDAPPIFVLRLSARYSPLR